MHYNELKNVPIPIRKSWINSVITEADRNSLYHNGVIFSSNHFDIDQDSKHLRKSISTNRKTELNDENKKKYF